VVTTPNGLEGTGLTHGRDVIVADDAPAFADAVTRLLDDANERMRLGAAAREHAARTFTPAACYQPLVDLIQARAAEAVQPGIIPSSVEDRLRTAIAALGRPDLVVWGNGSHTRSLLDVLKRLDVVPRCIVDKSAAAGGHSPEGVAVVPAAAFEASDRDLIVLSSQTFEAEMWRDVSAVVGAASAIALYRRELVTPDLARRMRTLTRQDAPVVIAQASGQRLVIVEPSAGKTGGHFYRPARALQVAAQAAGARVVLAGSRRIALEGLDLEDRLLLAPAFEFSHWDTLASLPDDRWRGLSRFGRMFGSDLVNLSSRLALGRDDVVMFAMGNLVELLGAVEWARAAAGPSLPQIRMLFHFLPEQEAQWLKITEAEVRHAYQVALGMLDDLAGDRVRLLAQSSALADGIADALGRRVDPVGFPVPVRLHRRASSRTGQPYRVLYAGEARADKGFGLLPALADALSSELTAGTVRLLCQAKLNGFADRSLKDAARALGERQGIEIIDRFLPSDGYDDLIAGCDLVLLPYDPGQYRARLSAVFVDATCAGVPVVVPDGTWMSGQLERGAGAGEVFGHPAAQDVLAAIRRALGTLPDLKRAAHARAIQACAAHDAAAGLDAIVARVAVAA
jgi:glycosyltransferase involved in cell wall biosynthesis